jgi:hypothetical protein
LPSFVFYFCPQMAVFRPQTDKFALILQIRGSPYAPKTRGMLGFSRLRTPYR